MQPPTHTHTHTHTHTTTHTHTIPISGPRVGERPSALVQPTPVEGPFCKSHFILQRPPRNICNTERCDRWWRRAVCVCVCVVVVVWCWVWCGCVCVCVCVPYVWIAEFVLILDSIRNSSREV